MLFSNLVFLLFFILSLVCVGWVTLLSIRNEEEIQINAKRLQETARRQGKKSIKRKILDDGMRFARVMGNCCWQVEERQFGGEIEQLEFAHTYYLPWSVHSIKLIDC